jgi:ATP citrate (pro-S)-lyase
MRSLSWIRRRHLSAGQGVVVRDLLVYVSGSAAITSKGFKVSAGRVPPMVRYSELYHYYHFLTFSIRLSLWPALFGRDLIKGEVYIQKLGGSTGASVNLTGLNLKICTMVAVGASAVSSGYRRSWICM